MCDIKKSSVGATPKTNPKMANTYSQIYIQFIFAVTGRESQILESHRERLQQYITGIIRSKEQKLLAIYANPIIYTYWLDLIN